MKGVVSRCDSMGDVAIQLLQLVREHIHLGLVARFVDIHQWCQKKV
jgi:hypothetical protein